MKINHEILENLKTDYPLEKVSALKNILFLDIETTGFTANSSCLYMVGCAYHKDGHWNIIQWLAENYDREKDLLASFLEFAADYHCLIHFNGNNFDIPFLMQKCDKYGLRHRFDTFDGVDLYRRIAPCKHFLKLPNCKQKTLEQFLDINREDIYSGGELIGLYHEYVKEPIPSIETALFQHNADDIAGMIQLLPLLAYSDILSTAEKLRARKVQANTYRDFNGSHRRELLITVVLPTAFPKPVAAAAGGCYFRGEGKEATIKVPIYDGELKYFYSNYQDYYYLPEEDTALHKSVAQYVDKDHRVQASAANCYTRKKAAYLPQWDASFQPYFKKQYQGKELFFELTDEMKRDRQAFTDYANQIFQMIAMSC